MIRIVRLITVTVAFVFLIGCTPFPIFSPWLFNVSGGGKSARVVVSPEEAGSRNETQWWISKEPSPILESPDINQEKENLIEM